MSSRTRNTLFNSIGGLLTKIISLLSAFVTRTIFIKVLGIQYAGVSGVFTDVLTILSFAELGIGSAIIYALYKPIAENDEKQILRLMNFYKKVYLIIAITILGLGLALLPFLNFLIKDVPDIKESIYLIYVLYLVNSTTSYLFVYKSTFLTACQKDYIVSKYKIIISIVKALIECLLLLFFKQFILYLVCTIAFTFIQNYIINCATNKKYPFLKERNKQKLTRAEKKVLFANVGALSLYKVSGTVLNGTDSVITSTMINTTTVGVYGNYTLITNQIYSFVMQIFTATSASIGNLSVESTSEHQYLVFKRMNFLCFWIYSFCATCLWTLLNPFITLWQGEALTFGLITVAFIVFDFYIKGMMSPVSQFRTSNGLFVQGKYRPLIMAVINIILSIAFVLWMGFPGVILGTVLSRISTQVWYDSWLIYREVFKKKVCTYYIRYIVELGITIISCLLSSYLLELIYPAASIIKIIFGLLFSFIVSNAFVVVAYGKTDEFKYIIQTFIRILKRKI